jgi:hypothetical protein
LTPGTPPPAQAATTTANLRFVAPSTPNGERLNNLLTNRSTTLPALERVVQRSECRFLRSNAGAEPRGIALTLRLGPLVDERALPRISLLTARVDEMRAIGTFALHERCSGIVRSPWFTSWTRRAGSPGPRSIRPARPAKAGAALPALAQHRRWSPAAGVAHLDSVDRPALGWRGRTEGGARTRRRLRPGHTPDNASAAHTGPCVSYVVDTPTRTPDTCRWMARRDRALRSRCSPKGEREARGALRRLGFRPTWRCRRGVRRRQVVRSCPVPPPSMHADHHPSNVLDDRQGGDEPQTLESAGQAREILSCPRAAKAGGETAHDVPVAAQLGGVPG